MEEKLSSFHVPHPSTTADPQQVQQVQIFKFHPPVMNLQPVSRVKYVLTALSVDLYVLCISRLYAIFTKHFQHLKIIRF